MPKKKSWLFRVKDFLFPETDEQERKLRKKRKSWLFGWMRTTKRPPSLAAPSLSRVRTEGDNGREQEIHQDSDEAGGGSTSSLSAVTFPTPFTSSTQIEEKLNAKNHLTHSQLVQHVEHLAAIKIQTAFRGYLARKALRALKGLVILQAIIRGRAVRRQAVATLKCLQSIINIQTQVCATRCHFSKEGWHSEEDTSKAQSLKNDKIKIESNSRRRWDDRLLTKDEDSGIVFSKIDAMTRRNRVKAYSFNHRHSAELEDGRKRGRLRYWLEEEGGDEVPQKEEIKRVDTIGGKQLRQIRNTHTHQTTEAVVESPSMAVPRRSFHCKKNRPRTTSEEYIPAYMAATESARARAQPMGSPRLRPMDCYSDGDSPYKAKISPMSSINSERMCGGGVVVAGNLRRRSMEGGGEGFGFGE